jgi:hypothetical protein
MKQLFTNPALFWHALFITTCAGMLIVLAACVVWEKFKDWRTDGQITNGMKYLFRSK